MSIGYGKEQDVNNSISIWSSLKTWGWKAVKPVSGLAAANGNNSSATACNNKQLVTKEDFYTKHVLLLLFLDGFPVPSHYKYNCQYVTLDGIIDLQLIYELIIDLISQYVTFLIELSICTGQND